MKPTATTGLLCLPRAHTGSEVTQGFHSSTRWSTPAVAATNQSKPSIRRVLLCSWLWCRFPTLRPTYQVEPRVVVHVPHAAPRQTGSDPQASAASLSPANHQAALRPSAAGRHRPLGAQVAHCGEMRSASLAGYVATRPSAESHQLPIGSVVQYDLAAMVRRRKLQKWLPLCKRPFCTLCWCLSACVYVLWAWPVPFISAGPA